MSTSANELTIDKPDNLGRKPRHSGRDRSSQIQRVVIALTTLTSLVLAATVIYYKPYTPRSGFAYVLGIMGGVAMLVLLLYPLRKRLPTVNFLGPLRHWFKLHMVCGIAGPLLILFHSTFQVFSVNAGVAVFCMLLVALSGIAGRFLYRRIHLGLYGRKANVEDLQNILDEALRQLDPQIRPLPEVVSLFNQFKDDANCVAEGAGLIRFFLLSIKRKYLVRTARQMLSAAATVDSDPRKGTNELTRPAAAGLSEALENACLAMQRTAQFARYERLFSLWHIAHVPFVFLFVFAAVVHVIAVHVY